MMNLKELIQLRWFCVILTFALLISIPLPAFAVDDSVEVEVTVAEMFCIEYTGDPVIYFYIDYDDIEHGSEGQMTDADLDWCSSIEPWHITVHRSAWDISPGGWMEDPSSCWYLTAKYGPPENSGWVRVWPAAYTPRSVFAHSGEFDPPTGTGQCENIDWQVKELDWDNAHPGIYTCTVTFTFVPEAPPE